MKFTAYFFSPEENIDKQKIEVDFEFTGVRLRWPSGERRQIPYQQLRMEIGGSNQHLYYFHWQQQPDTCFYVQKSPELERILRQNNQAHFIPVLRNQGLKKYTALFLQIVFLVVFATQFLKISLNWSSPVDWLVRKIPPEAEQQVGDKIFEQISLQWKFYDEPELLTQLENIVAPFRAQLPAAYRDFKIHIVRNPELNAFAFLGNRIVIFDGALRSFTDYSEFAGVLSHELQHLQHRHALRSLVSGVSIFYVVSFFVGDLGGLFAVLAESGSRLLSLSYSRDFEREADEGAFQMLTQLKIDPTGLRDFFARLRTQRSEKMQELESRLEFLATHPATEEREKAILEAWQIYQMQHSVTDFQRQQPEFARWQQTYFAKGETQQ